MQRIAHSLAIVALGLALASCGGGGDPSGQAQPTAAAAEPDAITRRQALLKAMGDEFRGLRGQLESASPDNAAILASAELIRTNAGLFIDLFPAGTAIDSGADTEALPIIWEDPEGFRAAHQRLLGAADGMLAAARSGEPALVQAAVGDLGGSCKNCHDTYRLAD